MQEAALAGQLQFAGVDLGQHVIETARGLQLLERLPARIQPVYLLAVFAVTGLTVLPNNHGHHRAPSGSCSSYTNHLTRPAISQGIARRAHETALAYAHTRIQGGKPIVEHGAVSDMLAAM
ncbi:acyl-CoA dehydrogenase family protein, partial [Streptomyces sp. DSM 41534]